MRVKCVLISDRRCYLFPADTVCVHINRMHAHARTVFLAILFHLRNGHLWERDLRLLVGVSFVLRSDEYAPLRKS